MEALYWWVIVCILLIVGIFIENIILFVTIRVPVMREFKLWWLRKRGYGIMEILYPSRMRKWLVVPMNVESITIQGKEHPELYLFDSQSHNFRMDDRIPIATFKHLVPTQLDNYAEERFYNIAKDELKFYDAPVYDANGKPVFDEGTTTQKISTYAEVKLPRANWDKKLSADKMAAYLVKFKFLAKDFFKKYYLVIIVILVILLLMEGYGLFSVASQKSDIIKAVKDNSDVIKTMLEQMKAASITPVK